MAKDPRAAFDRYAHSLKGSLQCLTDAHVINNIQFVPNRPVSFGFSNNPAKLKGSPYSFFFVQNVEIIEDERSYGTWKVRTLSYTYAIERTSDRQEILAYHWEGLHGRSTIPHMHLGFAAKCKGGPLNPKAHIPCGRVAVEDIITFLIQDLGVKPTRQYASTWQRIIDGARAAFVRFKTW